MLDYLNNSFDDDSCDAEDSSSMNNDLLAKIRTKLDTLSDDVRKRVEAKTLFIGSCPIVLESSEDSEARYVFGQIQEIADLNKREEALDVFIDTFMVQQPTGDFDTITKAAEAKFGPSGCIFHEEISTIIHTDIMVFPPTEERDNIVLLTCGMSALPMQVPEDCQGLQYAELMMVLPKDWPLDEEAIKNMTNFWPMKFLQLLSRYPHQEETWLGVSHTMQLADPPKPPLIPGTRYWGCAFCSSPFEDFQLIELPDGTVVNLILLLPLYQEEVEFALEHDFDALMEKFGDNIPFVLQRSRVNVITGKLEPAG